MSLVLRLAWRNLWRQPRRTWLTTAAMVFSNVLLVFLMSMQIGMYGMMIDNSLQLFSGHMQIQAAGYLDDKKMRQTVPDIVSLAKRVRTELGSDKVAARGFAFALASSEERSYGIGIYGVEPEFESEVSTVPGLVREGRFLQQGRADEIVIGGVLARNLKVGIGDEITLLGSGVDGSFAAAVVTVAGIYESGITEFDRNIAEIPLATFQETFFMQGSGHQVAVVTESLDEADLVKTEIESMLAADSGLVVPDWDQLQPGLKQAIQADLGSSFFMYFVLVVLVAFSVLNTQLMSVLERTREFGITMSLGLKPGRLGRLVLLETALMGLMGVVLGAIVGALFTSWFTVNGLSFPGMEEMSVQFNLPSVVYPRLSLLSLLAGPLVVFVFTMLAAAYPAARLHWLHPVEAMRAA